MSIRKTIYKCDVCGKETYKSGNYGIFVRKPEDSMAYKKIDLCKKCYKEIESIIKSKKNKGEQQC